MVAIVKMIIIKDKYELISLFSIHRYAKMWYGSIYHKTRVINSNDPRWNARYDLGNVSKSSYSCFF